MQVNLHQKLDNFIFDLIVKKYLTKSVNMLFIKKAVEITFKTANKYDEIR